VNQLSWLIYLAEALDGLKFLFMWGILVFLILTGVSLVFMWLPPYEAEREIKEKRVKQTYHLEPDITYVYGEITKTAEQVRKEGQRVARGYLRLSLFLFVLSIVGANALPSKDTVYAIAASEVGESVLNSPTGSKAVQALNAWLDRQINPPSSSPWCLAECLGPVV